jgi:hypothetical protein
VIKEEDILANDIWNMDETGFRICVGRKQLVITKKKRNAYFALPENRESATAIEAISGGGEVCPAFIVLAGQLHMSRWYMTEPLDSNTAIAVNPSGYSNDLFAIEWIRHFDKHTKAGAYGRKRLLIVDGYGLYHTKEFIQYCRDNGIIPFGLPPHSTHLLQPLNVVCFQPYKHYQALAVDYLIRDGIADISKVEFLLII